MVWIIDSASYLHGCGPSTADHITIKSMWGRTTYIIELVHVQLSLQRAWIERESILLFRKRHPYMHVAKTQETS